MEKIDDCDCPACCCHPPDTVRNQSVTARSTRSKKSVKNTSKRRICGCFESQERIIIISPMSNNRKSSSPNPDRTFESKAADEPDRNSSQKSQNTLEYTPSDHKRISTQKSESTSPSKPTDATSERRSSLKSDNTFGSRATDKTDEGTSPRKSESTTPTKATDGTSDKTSSRKSESTFTPKATSSPIQCTAPCSKFAQENSTKPVLDEERYCDETDCPNKPTGESESQWQMEDWDRFGLFIAAECKAMPLQNSKQFKRKCLELLLENQEK